MKQPNLAAILAAISIFFSLLLLFFRNAVGALVSFVFCIVFSSISLLGLNIEFLVYIYLLVYVGAVAILILFSILILNLSIDTCFKKKIFI